MEVSTASLGPATHPRNPKLRHATHLCWAKKYQRVFPKFCGFQQNLPTEGPKWFLVSRGHHRCLQGSLVQSQPPHKRGRYPWAARASLQGAYLGPKFPKNRSRSCKWQLTGSPVTRLDTSSCSNTCLRNRGFLCDITRYAHLYHLPICEQQQGDQQPLNCQTCRGKAKAALSRAPALRWPRGGMLPPPWERHQGLPKADGKRGAGGPKAPPAPAQPLTSLRRRKAAVRRCAGHSAEASGMLQGGCSSAQVEAGGISAFPGIKAFG